MTRPTFLTAVAAGLVLSLSGVALAQAPVPYQRSMNPSDRMHGGYSYPSDSAGPMYDRRQAYNPNYDGTYQSQVPLARRAPGGATMDPSGRIQTDRFGNVVRGDSCADHPANCAFDPSMQGGPPVSAPPTYSYGPRPRYYVVD
jgi:hypothetical protein